MNRTALLAGLVVAQLALVGVGVAPQLSARTTGETFHLRTAPVDPIDPFRGAYVQLSYPGLTPSDDAADDALVDEGAWDLPSGDVYVPLVPDGPDLVKAGEWRTTRPADGPYLACHSNGWSLDCGIESLFASQDRALQLEQDLAEGNGIAEIKVDSRGNAAVVDVRAE